MNQLFDIRGRSPFRSTSAARNLLALSLALMVSISCPSRVSAQDITIADAGLSSFVASGHEHDTVVNARLAELNNQFVVDFYGDQRINFVIRNNMVGRTPENIQQFKSTGWVRVSVDAVKFVIDHSVRSNVKEARIARAVDGGLLLE